MAQSLAKRAALLTGSVALAVVAVAGPVSLTLVRGAAFSQEQSTLSAQADLIAEIATQPQAFMDDGMHRGQLGRELVGVLNYLGLQGITVQSVIPGSAEPAALTKAEVASVAAGHSVSKRNCDEGVCEFVEARPISAGSGVVLSQPLSVAGAVSQRAFERILTALVVGLLFALIVGLIWARRMARPVARAAEAARQLATGRRDISVEPEGPTELIDLADALNSLATALAHSEGRQREFLLNVSHELRTPLTAIRGYAEAMSDGVIADGDVVRVGEVVSSEAERLNRLVTDLLELARTGAVDFPLEESDVDLRELLEQAAEVWSDRCAREGVRFHAELPAEPIVIHTDAVRVRQIVDNLAENALRVTPAGAEIVFALTGNCLEVRDGGPGLSAEDRAVAFAPGELFDRYRGVRKVGTGFGLALVGQLAARLGAQASVGIAGEGGAAFRIDFAPTIGEL